MAFIIRCISAYTFLCIFKLLWYFPYLDTNKKKPIDGLCVKHVFLRLKIKSTWINFRLYNQSVVGRYIHTNIQCLFAWIDPFINCTRKYETRSPKPTVIIRILTHGRWCFPTTFSRFGNRAIERWRPVTIVTTSTMSTTRYVSRN